MTEAIAQVEAEKALVVEPELESSTYDGIDLSRLVLIERLGRYYVTADHLASPDYIPNTVDEYKVRFQGRSRQPSTRDFREGSGAVERIRKTHEYISFSFDRAVYGRKEKTREMIARSLIELGGLK